MSVVSGRRIGMITPSSNRVLEPVTIAMTGHLYPRVSTHYTRIEVQTITLEAQSLQQFDLEPMLAAARLLADAGVDVIAWSGTSGAWRGVDSDRVLCDAITRETGTPATTATLAQVHAFQVSGIHTYALAVPYVGEVAEAILGTYEQEGFHGSNCASLGISRNADFADVPAEAIRRLARRSDSIEAEAIAVVCTNLPAAWLVEELEAELGKPVFDSAVVTVWHALRLTGWNEPLTGWGTLLRDERGWSG